MAAVGLRMSGMHCIRPAGSLLTKTIGRPTIGAVHRQPNRIIFPATAAASLGAIREHNSTAFTNRHFFLEEFGLFSDFYSAPLKHWPSFFSKEWYPYFRKSFREMYRGVWSFFVTKYNLTGWSKKQFAAEAEGLYNVMNEVYAAGDLDTLGTICMSAFHSKMKGEIKRRQNDFEWEVVRSVNPPKILKIRSAAVAPKFTVSQITLRIDQIQRVVLLPRAQKHSRRSSSSSSSSSAPISAPITKETHVVEYVVFQRLVTDKTSPWVIYRKLDVPTWDLPAKKK
ncbi:hypothetical protein GGI11_000931 [Coemansia sp. RSA 2049]|nr:hypothetical protein H4217_000810 [Coemansia sp. RSA 1939]KAJ2524275.1 hypothetical protein GGI11_000931 [Coemansia sp. RSA 2049]KAJ2616033.1 hypothetical protein EV177_001272 [Coemansia sp. RSA 1804]